MFFPCSESLLRTFICNLREQGYPASSAKGVLETIAFIRHTQWQSMSVRKAGDAGEPPQTIHSKRNLKLALSLSKLALLHSILKHDADLWDRAFSGTVLFVTWKNALPLMHFHCCSHIRQHWRRSNWRVELLFQTIAH